MCGLGNLRDLLKGTVLLQGSFSFFVPAAGHRESTWAGRDEAGTTRFGSVSRPRQPPASHARPVSRAETGTLRLRKGPGVQSDPARSSGHGAGWGWEALTEQEAAEQENGWCYILNCTLFYTPPYVFAWEVSFWFYFFKLMLNQNHIVLLCWLFFFIIPFFFSC